MSRFQTTFIAALAAAAAPLAAQEGTLVVLNKAAATASLIDIASGRTVATLPTGTGPHEMLVTRDGRWAVGADYGARVGGNTLTLIDIPGKRVAKTIDLGSYTRPHGLAFLPGDSLLAVTSETTQNVVVVRIPSGEVAYTVATEQSTSHMVTMPIDGSAMYTSNIRSNTVSGLSPNGMEEARIYQVPTQPEGIGVTPSGDEVWVGSNDQGIVSVLDPESGQIIGRIDGFGFPYRVAFTPDERVAIVPDPENNRVRFFDRATRAELGAVELPGASPQGVVLTPDGKTLYVSLNAENQVAEIDIASRSLTRKLATGAAPDGIGYSRVLLN